MRVCMFVCEKYSKEHAIIYNSKKSSVCACMHAGVCVRACAYVISTYTRTTMEISAFNVLFNPNVFNVLSPSIVGVSL